MKEDQNNVVNPYDKVEGMLLYASIRDAVKAYQKPGTDPKPQEWKVSVVLTDEDYVDELEDWAKKNDVNIVSKVIHNLYFNY